MNKSDLSKYMAAIGSTGGRAGGRVKVRGDVEYYRELSKKAAKARRAKKKP